jgi:hypothetical protein
MTRRASRIAAFALLAATGACGHSGPSVSPAPVADAPCTAFVASRDLSTWKAVAADGFTFCVPPEWQLSRTSAIGHNATLSWGIGEHTRTAIRTEIIAVKASDLASLPSTSAQTDSRRFTETIGGHDADVWRVRSPAGYFTGAQWRTPRVWLQGTEQTPEAAELELTIIRTVRFPSA